MFLCDPCHKAAFGEGDHLSQSRGPCEACGKTASCSDCHCQVTPKTAQRPTLAPPSASPLPELTRKPKSGPFIHQKPCQIRVHRRTIASNGYPPHHPIWAFFSGLPTAILDGYAAVSGNTCIWIFPHYRDDGYAFYILREHGEEWEFRGRIEVKDKKEFIP
jgi:hypothetical protein